MSNAGGMQVRSPRAEMMLGANNTVESALFTGGVDFESDQQGASGHSGEMLMRFARVAKKAAATATLLQTIDASQGVTLRQAPKETSKNPQALAMSSNAMTFALKGGRLLSTAQTHGPGHIVVSAAAPKSAGEQTVIDAQHFTADFGEQNRLRTVHGVGAVQVTSRVPGQPDKVSTSDTVVAEFTPAGEISRVVQEGNFRFNEGQSSKSELGGRTSFADRATYSPLDDSAELARQSADRRWRDDGDGGQYPAAAAQRRGFCRWQREEHLQRAEASARTALCWRRPIRSTSRRTR